MRDGTRLASAFLQSEMYRENQRAALGRSGKLRARPSREQGGGSTPPKARVVSKAVSELTLLGLLGLLEHLQGG